MVTWRKTIFYSGVPQEQAQGPPVLLNYVSNLTDGLRSYPVCRHTVYGQSDGLRGVF